jgi:hypothetical protein
MKQATLDAIIAQAINEISVSRTFKQGKTRNWQLNERMYYGADKKLLEARSSVQLARMQEFVHTLLSKIDNPLVFNFVKRKNAQRKRVERLNALRRIDQAIDNWDIKDIVGKKEGIIYGRAIYSYYADSINGRYKPHLEPVDVYDFLIDPYCGGLDIEQARYLGSYSVILDKRQLEQGAKDKIYIKKAVQQLIQGAGNRDDATQEETNKQPRTYDQRTTTKKSEPASDVYKFWRWFTTYEGERYYLLMTNSGDCIRCEKLVDVLPADEEHPQGLWPFWTWAAFPDLTEFWTPSYCDYVREIFMAQDVSVNQMLDNAEAINKPMKVVNTMAVKDMSKLRYRRDGIIPVEGDMDASRAVQFVQTPSIQTPINVFQLLEGIHEKVSGVTAGSKGVEDTDGKVGIYEGNKEATADRFGLLNKSYAFGYKRFAKLYEMGVRDNLVKRVAIEILGPNGVELEEVKRTDIFKKGDSFGVVIEASNAEMLESMQDRKAKLTFLSSQAQNPIVNKKKSTEMQAEIIGFTQDQIDELLDVSVYGNASLISEADADIESVLLGENIQPNLNANAAYLQRIVDFLKSHGRNLSMKDFANITAYIDSLRDIVAKNEARAIEQEQIRQMKEQQPDRGGRMSQSNIDEAIPAPDPNQLMEL